jgi:hypothetical protein
MRNGQWFWVVRCKNCQRPISLWVAPSQGHFLRRAMIRFKFRARTVGTQERIAGIKSGENS